MVFLTLKHEQSEAKLGKFCSLTIDMIQIQSKNETFLGYLGGIV